jgi:hypothetical protein
MAKEIGPSAALWSTRPEGPARILALLLNTQLHAFGAGKIERLAQGAVHYAGLLRRFPPAQIKQIFFDKYDAGYRWRSLFARHGPPLSKPAVLIPSAYVNVSRMAADYARLLPEQQFLMVATRRSARQFEATANIEVRDLAAYMRVKPQQAEIDSLERAWRKLRAELCEPELRILADLGELEVILRWIRKGLFVRNAWTEVFEREPVCGVLCGDDSNPFTTLPVLLAAKRNIPTVDFHHGAFDGRYLLKDLPCEIYLAKNEAERDYLGRVCQLPQERVMIGAPSGAQVILPSDPHVERASVFFFSEPYEVYGMRAEEVYRELLPRLSRIAQQNGRELIVKLHPFESRSERWRLICEIVGNVDSRSIRVLDGPLTEDLLRRAWFGITVESTTVIDCLRHGVPCFLCGWYNVIPCGYLDQYERFGVGERLAYADEIARIPSLLAHARRDPHAVLPSQIDPAKLRSCLTTRVRQAVVANPSRYRFTGN